MRLFLLRHAEAVNTSPDPTRPLTRKGHEDVRKLGEFLRARGDFEVGYRPF